MDDLYKYFGLPPLPTFCADTYKSNGGVHSNVVLRHGAVIKKIPPTSPRSISKKFAEYDVMVQEKSDDTGRGNVYANCIAVNLFGGLADKMNWTLREAAFDENGDVTQRGSQVLMLCINGETYNAIIIGGVRDDTDTKDDNDKEGEHRFHFRFNGLDFLVNTAGEAIIQCLGAAKNDGSSGDDVQSDVIGTKVELLQDGSYKVTSRDEEEILLIDRKNHAITLQTKDGEQSIKLNHDSHKIEIVAKDEFNLSVSSGKTIVKSQGVEIGDATEAFMMGTTYRNAENQMHQTIGGLLTAMQALMTSAATLMKVPVTGAVGAAALFDQIAVLIGQTSQAISQFESNGVQFTSRKNKND